MFQLIRDGIKSADGQDSSGKQTFTRSLGYTYDPDVDTVVDLLESNLYPEPGGVHPVYTQWTLESVSSVNTVVSNGAHEMWFTCKYSRRGNKSSAANKKDVPPWELGAQNFRSVYEKYQSKQVKKLYIPEKKKWVPYVNGAGCPLVRTIEEEIRVISFDVHKRYRGKFAPKAAKELYNPEDYRVCGIPIPAYCGKLMPMTSDLHTVYENDGKTVKWQYETVHYTIKINNDTWKVSDLNVGRLAMFPTGADGKLELGPIFQYTPWESSNPTENANIRPTFGSISEVMAAQSTYERRGGKGKIPYTQFDEDLPLRENGTLYTEAIEDPINYPYLTIEGMVKEGTSWNGLGIPKEI